MDRCDLHSFAQSITFIFILYIHTKRAYEPLKPGKNRYLSVFNSCFTAIKGIICFSQGNRDFEATWGEGRLIP